MAGFFDRFFGPGFEKRPIDRDTVDEALVLIRDDRKIQAVKVVRERTGMGLVEAKHVVDAIQEGHRLSIEPAPGHSLADRSRELLSQDRVTEATTMVSRETGMTETESSRFLDVLDR